MSGLALETATEHVEVLVCGADGKPLAHRIESVGHGHTRRLAALTGEALAEAGVTPDELEWIAADLGPGSFTGVRVGLATAQALALVSGAFVTGASSLASLAIAAQARRCLVVPLVPAGRRDVYAGWFRTDSRAQTSVLAAPEVGEVDQVIDRTHETLALLPRFKVRFVGPAVPRLREALDEAFGGSTEPGFREAGLSALDLATAVRSELGPVAGLPPLNGPLEPLYVRPAQAEERVRHRVTGRVPIVLRPFTLADIPAVAEIEEAVFPDPWPESFFASEVTASMAHARVAERDGELVGYSVAWLGVGSGHLGNLAVATKARRHGIASRLIDDMKREAITLGVERVTLEVRVSNFSAQWLYRRHGFRLAGLRRRYYRDTGEDALVMEWRPGTAATSGA
jgi:tRNA threonylcarbamoyl adenosine modification protein YeaZ/ribosomal-protein-alanine acetyltransferase